MSQSQGHAATPGSSRLQKLLRLIDGGSNLETRKAAAAQVAGVVAAHPAQLPAVLGQVAVHLRHKEWDARVAASHCLGLIAQHFQHHSAADLLQAARAAASAAEEPLDGGSGGEGEGKTEGAGAAALSPLCFAGFRIDQVLEQGTPLLASGGEEYDLGVEAGLGPAELLARQRTNLKKRLGLEGPMDSLLATEEMFGDEDLLVQPQQKGGANSSARRSSGAGSKEATQLLADMGGLSARERAAALRRAKSLKRQASGMLPVPSPPKRPKQEPRTEANGTYGVEAAAGEGDAAGSAAEQEWQELLAGRWPFQALCDQLCLDVLHPQWEVRHGAAAALRDVLRSHAGAAGVHAPVGPHPGGWSAAGSRGRLALGEVTAADAAAAQAANAAWLEDAAIHLLCVLALDRFGDFVSDQVVAPVRETAAQALGAVAQALPPSALLALLAALRQLSECQEWEARHGGLLGLKYVLAAHEEPDAQLLAVVLPAAAVGLQDGDDDVQAAAAEALLPVAGLLAKDSSPAAQGVRAQLWDMLLSLEELSPATACVVALLAEVHSAESVASSGAAAPAAAAAAAGGSSAADLGALVPRLWPFLRHGLSSVRLATVRCLAALLEHHPVAAVLPGGELQRALRLLFQNLLLEARQDVLQQTQAAWQLLARRAEQQRLWEQATPEVLAAMVTLACTPARSALSRELLLVVPLPSKAAGAAAGKGRSGSSVALSQSQQQREGRQPESLLVEGDGDSARTTRMRLAAARALGQLAHALPLPAAGGTHPIAPAVEGALRGASATGRILGAFVVTFWVGEELGGPEGNGSEPLPPQPARQPGAPGLQHLVGVVLEQLGASSGAGARPFSELSQLHAQLRSQASAAISRAVAANVALAMPCALSALGADSAAALAAQIPGTSGAELQLAKQALQATAGLLQTSEAFLQTTVGAALAVAVVHAAALPSKLNGVIQPLIAATRREPQPALQDHAGGALAGLVVLCAGRTPSPNDKVIKNICGFACGDPRATPSAAAPPQLEGEEEAVAGGAPAVGKSSKGGGKGKQAEGPSPAEQQEELAAQALSLARRGGEAALRGMARLAGEQLPQQLPKLWEQASAPLDASAPAQQQAAATELQAAVNALHVLGVVAPALHPQLLERVQLLLPLIARWAQHPNNALKLAAACCLAALAEAHTEQLMPGMLRVVTPLIAGSAGDDARLGGLLALQHLISCLGLALLPYSLLVVVPLMARMSDPLLPARASAARSFASAVALMPLAQGLPPPPGLDAEQQATLQREGGFLQQLLDNSAVEDYTLPVSINGTLRRYQQEGINWLAFLRRFGLHGVLADDMGLGKTLQATAIMASHAHEQRQAFAATGAAEDRPRPSLIVCPSSLVAHWPFEISKFVGADVLRPLLYHGGPAERSQLQASLAKHDLVVMSYESLRADVDWVSRVAWGYCILDEGHAISNPASRVTQACKRVQAQHRIILSGTPIQNHVLELWSLFDFLMPGFLGSQRQFNARYGRAVASARGSGGLRRTGGGAAEAGVLALEGLHRQVMPFIMRRTKDQVLHDLPPKIIQDLVCEPSELQRALYEDFAQSQALAAITGAAGEGPSAAPSAGTLQSLLYLRKLCSHPLLVLDQGVPQHVQAVSRVLGARYASDWPAAQAALRTQLAHAPKLLALRELLLDSGIGREEQEGAQGGQRGGDLDDEGGADAGHRVLVFAQLKGLLDLVESTVLGPLGISFLRLDGSVDATERFRRVQRFNADPTIDVMLLTTQVGGLGLNLTAADTVVFLEHDWNPMRDLQAMDRAHRLGQQRTVNVYRLLVRGTLEEQIMSLQRFKLDVAAAVVNQDNMSLGAMDTGGLLDLFSMQQQQQQPGKQQQQQAGVGAKAAGGAAAAAVGGKGDLTAVLEGLGDLEAAEEQYAGEFNLAAFRDKLRKA